MTNRVATLRLQIVVTEMSRRIGQQIQKRRLALGLNQRELAERMPPAVSNQTVSNWERGINQPSPRYLGLLATALEVDDVGYFYIVDDVRDATPDLSLNGAGQLDRIEEKLEELLRRVPAVTPAVDADAPPPPGELGRDATDSPPNTPDPGRDDSQEEPGSQEEDG